VLAILISLFVLIKFISSKPFYKSNAEDAFSYAAGFALNNMVGGHLSSYSCGDNPSDNRDPYYFFDIQVQELSPDIFYVIGATQAVNQYCLYDVSYFVATVYYLPKEKNWKLYNEVFFSNPCVTTLPKDGECINTQFRIGWSPDYSWRPSTNSS